jgi:hypothetical protein
MVSSITLYQEYMLEKYGKLVLKVLGGHWRTTAHVLKLLSKKHRRLVSRHVILMALKRLAERGRLECATHGRVFLWRARR